MKQAYNRVITPDQARTAMLEGFMDKLDIELKIFAKGLRDSMVKDKKTSNVGQLAEATQNQEE